MVLCGPRWSRKVTNYHKWSQMVPNSLKLSQIVISGHKWSQIVPNGPKLFQTNPISPKWSPKIPNDCGCKWSLFLLNKFFVNTLLSIFRHSIYYKTSLCNSARPLCSQITQPKTKNVAFITIEPSDWFIISLYFNLYLGNRLIYDFAQ